MFFKNLGLKNWFWKKRRGGGGESISFIKAADLQVTFFSINRTNTGVTFQETSGVNYGLFALSVTDKVDTQ